MVTQRYHFFLVLVLMLLSKVKSLLDEKFPGCSFNVKSTKDNGRDNHVLVEVLEGDIFIEKTRMQRDEMIYSALSGLIGNEVHAIQTSFDGISGPSLDVSSKKDLNSSEYPNIDSIVKSERVVLFMKGSKLFPKCGFSQTVVWILNKLNVEFKDVNVLEDDIIRNNVKGYSDWPTIPQLYVDGNFIGGCDVVKELYQTNKILELFSGSE